MATEMKSMLSLLSNDEASFINICGSLYNAAIDVATAAVRLAAQSRRIMGDLYDAEPTMTPLEEYAASLEEGDDGFETADEGDEAADEISNDESEEV